MPGMLSLYPTFKLTIPCGDGELPGSGVARSCTYAWRADGTFSKCTMEPINTVIIVIPKLFSHPLLLPRRWTRWDHYFVTFLAFYMIPGLSTHMDDSSLPCGVSTG